MTSRRGRARARQDSACARAFTGGILIVATFATLAAGCAGADRGSPARSAAVIDGTFVSPGAVVAALVSGLERGDEAALAALALDAREFREVVWPELPASRPERNLSADFVWSDLSQKSRAALQQILAEHGGARLDVVGIDFAGDTTRYASFAVHRRSRVTVRAADGREVPLKLFGSLIEQRGRYKIFSYVVD